MSEPKFVHFLGKDEEWTRSLCLSVYGHWKYCLAFSAIPLACSPNAGDGGSRADDRGALEITVQDSDGHYLPWGRMIYNMEARLKTLKKSDRATHDHWQPVMGFLYHVKKAWRNDTMHPVAKYEDKEASKVFKAVKAFMRHLAEKV